MDPEAKLGAGKVILMGAATAILLLWMDGAGQSLPKMLGITALALVVFLALRQSRPARPLTHEERLERERQDALRWMAKSEAENQGFQIVEEHEDGKW